MTLCYRTLRAQPNARPPPKDSGGLSLIIGRNTQPKLSQPGLQNQGEIDTESREIGAVYRTVFKEKGIF